MKKLGYLLVFIFLSGLFAITSCKKDDEKGPPLINFKGGGDYISGDVSLDTSAQYKVGITASIDPVSKADLVRFQITSIFENGNTITKYDSTGFKSESFNADFSSVAANIEGNERLEFIITDKDGKTASVHFTITTEIPEPPPQVDTVSSNLNITLGSWNDTDFGSFYSTSNHTVYFKDDAVNNQEIIDFAFFLTTTTEISTIAAPASQSVQDVFDISSWTILNDTKIEISTITATDFDNIGDTYEFPEFMGTENEVDDLSDGDVLILKTVEEKIGFIKINNINGKGDKINIDVKIQK